MTQPARKVLTGYLACVGIPLQAIIDAASGLDQETSTQPILRGQNRRRSEGRPAPCSALSYSTLFRVVKSHFASRVLALEADDPAAAQQLRRATGHWLRHSFASQALQSGVPIDGVQKALGRTSVSTTGRYLTTEAGRMDVEMEKFASSMD